MAYSRDLRENVIAYLANGHTQESAKAVFNVGLTTIKRWKKQYEETGDLSKKAPKRSFKKIDPEKLTAYVAENPDAYLREIAEAFGCTDMAVYYAMRKLEITRKKDQALQRARPGKGCRVSGATCRYSGFHHRLCG